MNFTREPIIETIITPKEGYKLTVKCTKGGASEYNVDAIEVVNFGTALFYRSLERPKAFLLPMSDFEVLETKETRVAIKSASVEKSVKIAGGKAKEISSWKPVVKALAPSNEERPMRPIDAFMSGAQFHLSDVRACKEDLWESTMGILCSIFLEYSLKGNMAVNGKLCKV